MNDTSIWTPLLIFAALVALMTMLKRLGQISVREAQERMKNGARVIDVRTPAEFNASHLSGVVNIPLDEIETALPKRVKDKNQVLLLHCMSGTRSGMAKNKLKRLGYTNVFNLGSYGRAKQIVGGKG